MKPEWMKGLDPLCLCRHDFRETGITWGLFLSSDTLIETVQRLHEAEFFLEDISCLDASEGVVVLYHFSSWKGADRTALYVILPHDEALVPTISAVYAGALWHERETRDFFGIDFSNHPSMKPLLLPEDMTEHPLQKAENERMPLKELLNPGEIVEKHPDFLFFDEGDFAAGTETEDTADANPATP